jgi:hypothetical protein
MHADAEQHLLRLDEGGVEAAHALLDIDRGIDRRHRRAELGQHRIARGADQPAAAGLDRRPPDIDLRCLQVAEGARLRALHHAGESRQVGMHDGGEAALRGGQDARLRPFSGP